MSSVLLHTINPQVWTGYDFVLVVGNGFDVNLGLKTSYSDFLSSPYFRAQTGALFDHLLKVSHKNWIDIEKELRDYSIHKNIGASILKQEYKLLCQALTCYMDEIKYNDVDTSKTAFKLIEDLADKNFVIFDFNYTNSIYDVCLHAGMEQKELNKRIIKVHGSSRDNNIVFGVEDSAPLRKEHVFLKKTYHRHFRGVNLNGFLNRAQQVHFFGHSLGESDYTYFRNFFTQISSTSSEERKEIFLYFHGDDGYDNLMGEIDALTNRNINGLKTRTLFNAISV